MVIALCIVAFLSGGAVVLGVAAPVKDDVLEAEIVEYAPLDVVA